MPVNRRAFIGLTSGLMLSTLEKAAASHLFNSDSTNMIDLKILATNWGFSGSLDELCAKVKTEGYDGIEMWWPASKDGQDELFAALKKYNLAIGFLCGSGERDYKKHLDAFKAAVHAAATQKTQKPLYINCHSGRDHFTFDQNSAFVEYTVKLSAETGIRICHETHRSRIMFAAHITKQFIDKYPGLRLTLDISHWCNVHESMLEDQEASVTAALSKTEHIHARIGHPEGPQVNDPRAPEWQKIVEQHFKWWDVVVDRKVKNNEPVTFLTEFGPPDYMPTEPYTRKALSDQWAVNVHMMNLLRERYKGRVSK
jgi:sugar phosphate isomerase/epimerase